MFSIFLITLLKFTARPHVHRIRTLNLRPDVAAYYLPPFRPKREPKLRNAILKFLRRFQAKDSSPALVPTVPPPTPPSRKGVRYAKLASDLVARMSNVEELNVEGLWGHVDGFAGPRSICCGRRNLIDLEHTMQTMIATGWSTFGSTLRRLKLHLPHYCFFVSTMPTLVFPCLEELDITLDSSIFLGDRVVPFINDHHSTLQSLELSFEDTNLDPCSYLHQIHNIPNLTTFRFRYHVIDVIDLDTSGLHTFLSTHATNLRALRLDLYTNEDRPGVLNQDDWSAQPVFHIALPRLESLELGGRCFTNLEKIGTYLRQYAHSLTVLKLERRHLLFREVEVLLEVLTGHDKLQCLTMYVLHLTPELLDLLAMKLPSLDHIYMIFQFVFPSQNETAVEDIDAQLVSLSFKSTVISYNFRVVVLPSNAWTFVS
jgi:hypothetical protein